MLPAGGMAAGGAMVGGGAVAGGAGVCACEVEAGAPVMSYVGGGCGDYIQETSYKFVGCGAGEFDLVATKKTDFTCFFIAGGVGVLALVVVVVILLLPGPTTTTTTTGLPYDCSAGYANWQSGWSISKKSWCCTHSGKGCQESTTPKPPPTPPPPPPPPSLPFDCNAGFANWQAGWSEPKKTWCCQHGGKGCPAPPPSLPFDCAAGFANWQAGWSEPKKTWCCQHQGKGCAPAPSSLPFDCAAGFANWQAGWSEPKKTWCCQNQGKGCGGPAPAAPGFCLIWGDPHIVTFDNSRADFYGEGIVWLVKSSDIFIQARYKATPFTHGLAATDAIAVGGPFLQGHVLTIAAMETGQITWDHAPILATFPSTHDAAGLGQITYNSEGNLVDNAMSQFERHIVHVDLPNNLHIQVMRWSHHINVKITMPPANGGQDGHCGNFNGNGADDTTAAIATRTAANACAQGESLFQTYLPYTPGRVMTLNDCPVEKQAAAKAECLRARPGLQGAALNACIFDDCMAGPQYVAQDTVY